VIEYVGEIVISFYSRTALIIYNYQLDQIRVNFWAKGVQYIFDPNSALPLEVVGESGTGISVLLAYDDRAEILAVDPTE
jgi:hypothetical protein